MPSPLHPGAAAPRARSLQDMAREVRSKTLQILQATRPRELLWAPAGTASHILWHAGHSLWVQDALTLRVITGKGEMPPGWYGMFQMGSRPAEQTEPWPSKEELYGQLQAQLPRLLDVIGTRTDEDLDALPPCAYPGDDRSLWQSILHGIHDEANHQGEMYLLLKMQRLNPART